MERSRRRRRLLGGALAGGLAGIVSGALIATAAPKVHEEGEPDRDVRSMIDAAHVPPFLTVAGEPVELRYAIVCPAATAEPFSGARCDGAGDVYARAGTRGGFTRLPLRTTGDSLEGRYVVGVPSAIASSPEGFSYYAVLRNEATGTSLTLPAGGADAPQRSLPLADAVTLRVGAHRFGVVRRPDSRVVDASWGAGVAEVGLGGPPGGLRIGPSSFDVAADGSIVLLDGVNSRIQRWDRGRVSAVHADLEGSVGDLAVAPDGTTFVIGGDGRVPSLRRFGSDGRTLAAGPLLERTWSQLRVGPDGPVVQQAPSEQWLRAAPALSRREQARSGRAGRRLADGSEVVVLRTGVAELRLARVAGGHLQAGWRILSDTPLGEVQLAEPWGNRLVAVVKTYTDARDEFLVLILDTKGLVGQFSVASGEWATSAPLARFRLVGSSLYHLGSTAEGAYVDRYDLEAIR
jgi:hypothetical protein